MSRLFTILSALLLVACSSDPADDTAASAPPAQTTPVISPASAGLAAELLGRIDADTAALWLSLEPLPQPLLDQLWAQMAAMSELSESAYEDMAAETEHPLLSALLVELGQLTSPEDYAERGININGVAGAHMVSIFPLLHWELSDQDAFAATLARIEADAELNLPRRRIEDQELIWVDLETFGLAIHHDQHFLTIGLVPDREDLLRRVANLDRATSALRSAEVNAFNTARGLRNDNSGFVDFQRLLRLLLDGEDELLVQARADGALAQLAQDPACRTELEQLTTTFPRKSYGTTALSATSMSMQVRLETDSGFGTRLSALADSPVALPAQRAGLLNFGMAFNLIAARDFGRALVGGWVENPPQCFLFQGIAEQASDWQLALNRPIPPLVTNLHGSRIHIDRVEIDNGQPVDVTGTIALFMRNPQMMLGMAQMFSPELAALDLRPGAPPQPVPSGLAPALGDIPAWLGLSETGLGLAIGAGQDAALPEALIAGSADSAIFAMGFDLARYGELLQLGAGAMPVPGGAPADFDPGEAADMMQLLAGIYSYLHQSVHLTPDGIDMLVRLDLKD